MEKRLVLSFVLSFLVLYVWAMLTPKKQQDPSLLNPSQENQEQLVSTDNTPLNVAETVDSVVSTIDSQESDEEKVHLSNQKVDIRLSNIGGSVDHIHLKEHDEPLPVDHIGGFGAYSSDKFSVKRQQPNLIEFALVKEGMLITRIYELEEDTYTVRIRDSIKNQTKMSKDIRLDIIGFTLNMQDGPNGHHKDKEGKGGPGDSRDKGLNEYAVSSEDGIKRKNNAWKFGPKEAKTIDSKVNWLAFRNRYYATIVKPEFETLGYSQKDLSERVFQITLNTNNVQLSPSQQVDFGYTVFTGPEKTDLLETYDSNFEDIKRYYKFGLFDGISKLIGGFMKILYGFIPNWGICIILVSIVIYYSMYPLTAKGMSSMKRMQALSPKIQKLKERYEDNPQKLNQEMMELYRREKINPLGGCLPMLLQMPVFIGLYQVLWRNVDFKGAEFLWIKDLSQPDRLFTLEGSLPFIGSDINLLPLLMVVIMAVQQRFSAKNMTITDPMQLQQQKMMATVMPLLLGFIFYKFASGLTLYFTMFYIFSTITQWKISKEPKVTTT